MLMALLIIVVFLNNWETGLCSNATIVVHVPGHLDVASITPGCTPAVLHDVVLSAALGAISNDKCTVIQTGGGARRLIVDSRSVKMEAAMAGMDSDRDWANYCKGSCHAVQFHSPVGCLQKTS